MTGLIIRNIGKSVENVGVSDSIGAFSFFSKMGIIFLVLGSELNRCFKPILSELFSIETPTFSTDLPISLIISPVMIAADTPKLKGGEIA